MNLSVLNNTTLYRYEKMFFMSHFKVDMIRNDASHKLIFIFQGLMTIINNQYEDYEHVL